MKSVLVTRPQEQAERTQLRLTELGFDPVVAPLIEIEKVESAAPIGDFDAIVVTSAFAVDALTQSEFTRRTDLPIFTTGQKTAERISDLGYRSVFSADGNASDLARLVIDHFASQQENGPRILYPCAETTAFDMKGELEEHGILCSLWIVYRNQRIQHLSDDVIEKIRDSALSAIILYSASAASALSEIIENLEMKHGPITDPPDIFALSEQVATHLPPNWRKNCQIAPEPNEDSLLRLLSQTISASTK